MRALDPFEIPLQGAHLIEANAGTGKTYTITTLAVRLLLERRLDIGQLLVVTYTNAATAELRRKVRDRLKDALAALRGERPPDDPTMATVVQRRRAGGDVSGDCRRLEAALFGFDDAAIFTIHGFCQRVLQEHAFESGVPFDTELVGDQRLLVDEIVRDFWTRELYDAPPELVTFLQGKKVTPTTLLPLARTASAHPHMRVLPTRPLDLDGALAAGGDPDALQARLRQLEIDLIAYVRVELQRREREANTQSFDDLLQRLDSALHGAGGAELAARLCRRFPVALVDEFQDTDPVQYRIFDAMCRSGGALFVVGDPKQAIYGFRGADVFAYVGAKRVLGDDGYTLSVNRRSSPALVRAINTLFGRARAPFVLPGIPYHPSQPAPDAADELRGAGAGRPPFRLLFVRRPPAQGGKQDGWINKGRDNLGWFHAAVAGEIVALLNADTRIGDRRIGPGEIAVLCRTNDQTRDMQASLSALGVPAVILGDASVFDAPEALAVESVIRAVADPLNTTAMTVALVTRIIGCTADDLRAARRDEYAWERWLERFQDWNETWRTSGFTAAFRALLDELGAPRRLLAQPGGERSLTNVLHLGELLQHAASDRRRGPLALVEWLQRMRRDAQARTEEAAESAQLRLESDTNALKLVTIHKSKGLQYPVVVCPFLWDGMLLHPAERERIRFHAPDHGDRLTLDLGSAEHEAHFALARREALAENLRLLYVALTRAQQLCVVAWGRFRSCNTSALGYLLHQRSDAPDDALGDATAAHIKALSEADMRDELAALAAVSEGAIEVADLSIAAPGRYVAEPTDSAELVLRTMSRGVQQCWRTASFSALASAERELPEPAEEGVDRDETADDAAAAAASAVEAGQVVRGFPRGRRLGNLVHKLFETIEFGAAAAVALREPTARLLPAYGVEPQWCDALCAAVIDVLDTPLTAGTPPLTLRLVPARRQLRELEFVFPVALEASGAPAGAVTATTLADVFAAHGAPWLAEDYVARVRRLPFAALSGYLKGYVDLVFAHDERWFVVDYKTNDLGNRAEDYRRPALVAAMVRHHYVLQYHLYVVALHRYLQQRLPGYDYERHFGGALYLFVRGMAPAHEPGCGVFFDRPARALVEGLSDSLAGPERVQRRTR
jgi:exodeoxyribonuclease V beta subunit